MGITSHFTKGYYKHKKNDHDIGHRSVLQPIGIEGINIIVASPDKKVNRPKVEWKVIDGEMKFYNHAPAVFVKLPIDKKTKIFYFQDRFGFSEAYMSAVNAYCADAQIKGLIYRQMVRNIPEWCNVLNFILSEGKRKYHFNIDDYSHSN